MNEALQIKTSSDPKIANLQSTITKLTTESNADVITALEGIGAMYGIPSTNIVCDNSLSTIKVVDDNILAPSHIKARGNVKPIICAIGSVLDYKSQQIDDKVDEYQQRNVDKAYIDQKNQIDSSPSKGQVMSRHIDANGDEVIVYDSGLVDMANNDQGCAKVKELRAKGMIPELKIPQKSVGYFSDEDDIAIDVDMGANSVDMIDDSNANDMSMNIGESASYIDLCAHFGDTTHLGYDLLQTQGFSYVKPVNSLMMESASSKKKLKASDMKHMKFDNKHMLDAIKYMNEARAEQKHAKRGELNFEQFINSENYRKAIDSLNKQFDASLNIRYLKDRRSNVYTQIWLNNFKTHLTISKSKGFQLNGAPIDIFVLNNALDMDAPDDISLFGQSVISVFCHEIFHNIAFIMRKSGTNSSAMLTIAMNAAVAAKTPEDKRVIMSKYVDSIDTGLSGKGLKGINAIQKKLLVKKLTVLSILEGKRKGKGSEQVGEIEAKSGDKEIDLLIRQYKKRVRGTSSANTVASVLLFDLGMGVIFASISGAFIPLHAVLWFGGWGLLHLGMIKCNEINTENYMKEHKNYEEHYCDLFASMYQLPVTFFIGSRKGNKLYVPNDITTEKLKELDGLERKLNKNIYSSYPTMNERNYSALKCAKELLTQPDLDPAIKDYCEWIVANFSSTADLNIDKDHSIHTYDNKAADDLDKHLGKLINDNKVVLSEAFVDWYLGKTNTLYNLKGE